ncbi:hypothetical protein [Haladaptatus halobius]|uniref:hypothetical protein n=1 Tax=Haladaptatus halobius TaxID=2884875 RepID=UPI001D0AE016|nr:hypothetical protein [Haladaptatus halobius]
MGRVPSVFINRLATFVRDDWEILPRCSVVSRGKVRLFGDGTIHAALELRNVET